MTEALAKKEADVLLKVKNLSKFFPVDSFLGKSKRQVKAVNGVNFTVETGQTMGLVGESGCGKSTTARVILRLLELTSGEIFYEGQNITNLGKKEMRSLRAQMQIVFQDPFSSLNPRMKVGEILGEPFAAHKVVFGKEREKKVNELLETVGLRREFASRYPHELSGGQLQRVGIGRALALQPRFIICDEAVSALDVSIQAQILNLLIDLQEKFKLTYLFISHDLRVIPYLCDKIGVMYLGKLVELAQTETLFSEMLHPYTQALFSAIPQLDPESKKKRILLKGDIPSPVNPPAGCAFHTRCHYILPECKEVEPVWQEVKNNHFVACHRIKNF